MQKSQDVTIATSGVSFDTPEPLSVDVLASLYPSTWTSYLQDGSGPLASNGGLEGVAHIHTDINTDPRPDIQLHLVALTAATDYGIVLRPNFGQCTVISLL